MRTARVGVLFPRPSGLAERQTTHPSTSGLDGCKRTVHEGASARESPCPTPVDGQRKVTDGSAVTLSLREGRRRREAPRREEQCDRTVPHVTKKCQTHAPHESVHVPPTDSTPHRLRTRMCNRTSHPHGFTHSRERASTVRSTSARDTNSCLYVGAALWFSGLGARSV